MHTAHHFDLQILWQRSCKWILLVCWILGLILGMVSAAGAGDVFFLTMRGETGFTVSIPGLLLVIAFPFLFTALAVFLSQSWLLLFLVFAKAFSFGFCAFGIMTVYSTASWLVQFFLMFTDGCTVLLLMWLWLRHSGLPGRHFLRDLAICLSISFALGILDYCAVSPFAAMLL